MRIENFFSPFFFEQVTELVSDTTGKIFNESAFFGRINFGDGFII